MEKYQTKKRNLGRAIQFYRKDKNMTQLELAQKCNVSNISISKIETGKSYPTSKLLNKISQSLDVSTSTLLNKAFIFDESKLSNEKIDILRQLKAHIEDLILKETT